MGAKWMRKHHFAELDPEYILDEGGVGSRDLFSPGKLVFGISVAEKKLLWLKLTAEGVAGHGSQPNDQNPNDRLTRALAHLLAEPLPTSAFERADDAEVARRRRWPPTSSTTRSRTRRSRITSLRSGVGDPPKANVIPSIAEAILDCRVLPGTSREQWLAEIRRRLADPAIRIDVINEGDDPVVTTTDSPFYRALEAAVKARYPDAIVTPMLVPYTHRRERVPPARRQELRVHADDRAGRRDGVDARRRRVRAAGRARSGNPDHLRRDQSDRGPLTRSYGRDGHAPDRAGAGAVRLLAHAAAVLQRDAVGGRAGGGVLPDAPPHPACGRAARRSPRPSRRCSWCC